MAREYALVQSELYFGGQGEVSDLTKMEAKEPDWIVFNGYANRYADDPLLCGSRTAGPPLSAQRGAQRVVGAFHVIGAILDRTWQEGVVGGPAQTISIAPSQGAIVEVTMEEDGTYTFVTHAFGDTVKGAVGCFESGDAGPATSGGH